MWMRGYLHGLGERESRSLSLACDEEAQEVSGAQSRRTEVGYSVLHHADPLQHRPARFINFRFVAQTQPVLRRSNVRHT